MNCRIIRFISILLIICLCLAGCTKKPQESATSSDWVGENKPSDFNNNQKEPQEEQNQPADQKKPSSSSSQKENQSNQKEEQENPSSAPAPSDKTPSSSQSVITGNPIFWLSPKGNKTRPDSAVKLTYDAEDGQYYFFCPAGMNPDSLQIWMAGVTACSIKNKTYQNGDSISLSAHVNKASISFDYGGVKMRLGVMQSANIGSAHISTASGDMEYIHAKKGNEEMGRLTLLGASGNTIYNGRLTEIRGRGNSTWERPKKSYQIKLEKKTDLIGQGAGEARSWVLLASYGDRSLVRNQLGLEIARAAGLADSSLSDFVDLYCNGEYLGTYQLCEKVQVAENRLEYNNLQKTTELANSAELKTYPTFGSMKDTSAGSKKGFVIPNNPSDITGTYLLEIEMPDRYKSEKSGFVTSRGKCVVIKEPERASREQVEYIANYFQEFEDAVYAKDGINPKTGKAFYDYFDLTSLAKKYVLEELVKNFDADKTSQYYYKPSDKESRVGFCGPVWDYDNAFDNFKPAAKHKGLFASNNQEYLYYHMNQHEIFQKEVAKVWEKNYLPAIKAATGPKSAKLLNLERAYQYLSPSAKMNFTVWKIIDTPIFTTTYVDTGSTYREHIDYLKAYLAERSEYLSEQWLK